MMFEFEFEFDPNEYCNYLLIGKCTCLTQQNYLIVLNSCSTTHILPKKNFNWNFVPAKETEYYRLKHPDDASGIPKLGLALSGGGQRAASVSRGFLEALYRDKKLGQIDVISSVSGGSYAAYWLYTKYYGIDQAYTNSDARKEEQTAIFRRTGYNDSGDDRPDNYCRPQSQADYNNGKLSSSLLSEIDKGVLICPQNDDNIPEYTNFKYFNHLVTNGALITNARADNTFLYRAEVVGKFLTLLPTIPANLLVNGALNLKINMNPFQRYYQNGIERDYGLLPVDAQPNSEEKAFANANDFPFFGVISANDPTDIELYNAEIKTLKLPYWIINTTAAYGNKPIPKVLRTAGEWTGYSDAFRHTVYEFSPLAQGSPWWGYCPGKDQCDYESYDLGRKVAISGAAFDNFGPFANYALDLFNASLGQYINNPFVPEAKRFLQRLSGILATGIHDESFPFIYLSDGGHSDNLGLYSLVRRGTKQIIVLDAERDNEDGDSFARFDGLQKARIQLWKEQDLLIDIPDIFHNKPVKDQPIDATELHFDFKQTKNAVFHGWICKPQNLTKLDCKHATGNKQELWYVKLATDLEEIHKGGTRLDKLEKCNNSCYLNGLPDQSINTKYNCATLLYGPNQDEEDLYPHDPTSDIKYSNTQVQGYVALGYDLGQELVRKLNSSTLYDKKSEQNCKIQDIPR